MSLFPCVWTRVGLNNIEPLNPEDWFQEGRGIRGGNNNGDGIWMPYHSKGSFLGVPAPSVEDLVSRK